MSSCSNHPDWIRQGMEWRCPHCVADNEVKPASPKTSNKRPSIVTTRSSDKNGWEAQRTRVRIRERDGYSCRACKRATRVGEIDHVVPIENGGSEQDDNLQLLCTECHRKKTARDRGYVLRDGSDDTGMPKGSDHHWNM
jgi:5-methylcytosine-specific restriction enzyme A